MRRISAMVLFTLALLISSFAFMSATASAGRDGKDGNDGKDGKGHDSNAAFHDNGELRLTSRTDQFKPIDNAPKGISLGDVFVFSDKVYSGSHQIGTLNGVCTLTRIDKSSKTFNELCGVTMVLPKGQLTAHGVIRESTRPSTTESHAIAITGGTGAYKGVSGEARVVFVSTREAKITIDLDNH